MTYELHELQMALEYGVDLEELYQFAGVDREELED